MNIQVKERRLLGNYERGDHISLSHVNIKNAISRVALITCLSSKIFGIIKLRIYIMFTVCQTQSQCRRFTSINTFTD